MAAPHALFELLLRWGDTALVLGHRLSEWCGHAPAVEEDIALANVALDLTGHAERWLGLAAGIEGAGRDADALAYGREAIDFRNLLLVERPNGDFGHTIVRQALFDAWHVELLAGLAASSDGRIAEVAARAVKEARYHRRHSGKWTIRLGDGTAESRARAQAALDALWPWTGEMFADDAVAEAAAAAGLAPLPSSLAPAWSATVDRLLREATLARPADGWMQSGGAAGRHSEHLGHLLAAMQSVPRVHPGARW
jgi:ring-1,2-phenylacetyl-CoA epoxidase subunit PaaC